MLHGLETSTQSKSFAAKLCSSGLKAIGMSESLESPTCSRLTKRFHLGASYFCLFCARYRRAGIKVLEPIDITNKNELFASNMLAFVTVHLHVGLAFLLLKRYKDAARTLNEVQAP